MKALCRRLKAGIGAVETRESQHEDRCLHPSRATERFSEAGSQRPGNVFKHRDIGVQCEKPTLVDRGCNTLQFIGQHLNVGDITSDKLTDLCASEDGNRQLALLLIKKEPQETECNSYAPGYFLLKQEGAEPILVRREPNKDIVKRVVVPPALQTITRPDNSNRGKSPPPPVIPSSCSRRVDSSGQIPNQTIQPSRGTSERTLENTEGLSSQNKKQNAIASAQTSTSSVLPNLTQTPASNVNSSVPMIELSGALSIPQTKPTASLVHRRPKPNPQTSNQTVVLQKEGSNICQNTYLTPVPPSQVLVTEPHSFKQRAQALVSHTGKTFSTIASLNQAPEPLTQCSSQLTQPPFFPPQSIKTPTHEMPPQVHTVVPSGHIPVAAAPNTLPPVQDRTPSSSLVPSQSHAFASPQVMPAHSVNSSPSFQFPLVLPHNPVQATPPSYLPTHVPFPSPHIPVNAIQGSISLNPPHAPLPQSQYLPQSNQFSSSPDHFFPPPDNTPGLLDSLDTLHLHSPIMITPQDASGWHPCTIFSHLGSLLPPANTEEQQAAAAAPLTLF
ncbi:proline-rich protein 36-like [Carassius auratus]|uniref:Proline-rich protein 36-like n=1 Tax=Carassius auratus TaxID=7957 RepID=A0A6P6P7E4_CARAU|nr:proline-rich protein 36-like [Carassius auratus]